ncbi:MAG: phosphoenolpyruvate synthase [Pseudomonadota bacterium]|jgi:pyruvate,water dikinase|uniref:phosphoenolpyruvate synthase n=1 Tax=Curvibacter delicatus TaxID=80879 RepID=UPI000836B50A|nr:phosphoenolpyruvate synthase [Curvibacter delicatus]MEA3395703.1 phosphoenolpyruvate synthase [Pseudomonadota bacterium]
MSALFSPTALVVPFENLRMTDVEAVGGKNASLGEMISQLPQGVRVPTGFATTAHAFREFLKHGGLADRINAKLDALDTEDVRALATVGAEIRAMVEAQPFPADLEKAIRDDFAKLSAGNPQATFAVRSSATAEDLPDASFAGQQETFLNVHGIEEVLHKMKEVFASLYNDRAISYRVHKGFAHADVALSAGVQRMVRSDLGAAGVMFTIDTESGFEDVVFITSSYGLGETVVQGAVNPDEFYVHKPMLKAGKRAVVRRNLGSKLIQMVFSTPEEKKAGGKLVKTIDVPTEQRNRYSLTDADVEQLAQYALVIEKHYGRPMDIEWGKDGTDGQLYILQARPETVKSQAGATAEMRYKLKGQSAVLAEGRAIGQKIGTGPVRLVHNISEMDKVQPGDVLVTDMTDPNWEPVMKRASAIVTNRGGRTCHAAIIARELGIPAVVGCGDATETLKDGTLVTVSCAEGDTGRIYDGLLEMEVTEVQRGAMPEIPVKITMNIGNPQLAFDFAQLPNAGVGLARLEFIINNNIGVHPKAILDYPNIDADLKKAVESVARGHASPRAFYVDKVAEGVATIAAAFWPKPVIVRLSDFKSNEYRKLIGGSRYEPEEENPMLGFRGAARYVSADFGEAFAMECEAMRRVRDEMGLTNVELMVPFVRTLGQAKKVIDLLGQHGLKRGENGLKIVMMCEVPSNAILADQFLEHFDGFSIGSNDLTQLTLGLDRDSGLELLAADFDERDPAVEAMISRAIAACRKQGKYVGICGQGPSDHPDFARWLVKEGITSISLNPDTVVETWRNIASM